VNCGFIDDWETERERNDRANKSARAEEVGTHPKFQRDAVVLTAAKLGIADFHKSDREAIIEATSMLCGIMSQRVV